MHEMKISIAMMMPSVDY